MANEFPEATARPWRADYFQYDAAEVLGPDGVRIGGFVRRDHQHSPEDDAKLAVTAVNSYDALRTAAEEALRLIEDEHSHRLLPRRFRVRDQLRAALHPQPQRAT